MVRAYPYSRQPSRFRDIKSPRLHICLPNPEISLFSTFLGLKIVTKMSSSSARPLLTRVWNGTRTAL